jgi:hypothetical protein
MRIYEILFSIKSKFKLFKCKIILYQEPFGFGSLIKLLDRKSNLVPFRFDYRRFSDPSPHRQPVGSATPPQGGSDYTEIVWSVFTKFRLVSPKSGGATAQKL